MPAGRIPGINSFPLSSRVSLRPRPLTSADLALSPTAPPPGPAGAAAFTVTRTAACAHARRRNPLRRRRAGARALVGVARAERGAEEALRERTSGSCAYLALPRFACRPAVPLSLACFGVLAFLLAFMIQGFPFPHDTAGFLLSSLSLQTTTKPD